MRKKERKICQRFVEGVKDARHAATRRHTHTQREREKEMQREERAAVSLSHPRRNKKTLN